MKKYILEENYNLLFLFVIFHDLMWKSGKNLQYVKV